MKNKELQPEFRIEREHRLPVINSEQQRFIEDKGGDYEGYIRSDSGGERYEEFWIDRRARYDEGHGDVVETYIATEAVDRDGEKEMDGPEDRCGFSILISRLSPTGEELGRPEIIMVRPTDFEDKRITRTELRELARRMHAAAVDNPASLNLPALSASLKTHLRSLGWNGNS